MSHNIYVNGIPSTFEYLLFDDQATADTWTTDKLTEIRLPYADKYEALSEEIKKTLPGTEHFRTYTSDSSLVVVEIVKEVISRYLSVDDKTKLKTPTELIALGFDEADFIYHL